MSKPQIAPFGSWKSPITAQDVFKKFNGLVDFRLDGTDLYWTEFLPEGRFSIAHRSHTGDVTSLTPPGFDVRTRVHEYGGGDFTVANGVLYFSNFSDQRLYAQNPGSEPQVMTPDEGMRYADAIPDLRRNCLILVREDHTSSLHQAVNTLVSISLQGFDNGRVVVQGNDFYSNPRLSPDGRSLAWLTWNHPSMPWENAELWVGQILADGGVGQAVHLAGGGSEFIFQPEWSPDGDLYFVSDRTRWGNLYRWRSTSGYIDPLCPMAAEFSEPQWLFDTRTYAFEFAKRLVCAYSQKSIYHLAVLDTQSGALREIAQPYTSIHQVSAVPGKVYFLGASPTQPTSLVQLDLETQTHLVLQSSRQITIDPANFSIPQLIEFPTENGLTAHGLFFPPHNPEFTSPADERPPLIVMAHGGPTAASEAVLRFGVQYWTSRGIGVLDVNYGGSTGYGRAYRDRLNGQWGLVDVADCVNGARYLSVQGLADPGRLLIRGGSAGGFIVLCALTFYDVFHAGASYFGVSDLESLAKDTHKFESHYTDTLVAPYPQQRQVYLDRSPIYHMDNLAVPIILLQGLDDPIVPPDQSRMMYEAVRDKGLPVAYLTFPGEQHGFVKAENNIRALQAELFFYSRILKFTLADSIPPILIENLEAVQ